VHFYRVNVEGREQVLKVFDSRGDTFCIASAFSAGKHIVSVKAAEETRVWLLDLDTVNRLRQHSSWYRSPRGGRFDETGYRALPRLLVAVRRGREWPPARSR
jgi:CRP-like cAMP-binding protein